MVGTTQTNSRATQALRRMAGLVLVAVLLCAGGAGAQGHVDSTRYKTHSNVIGKDPAQALNLHLTAETRMATPAMGTVLARSNPAGSTDGWQGVRLNNVPSTTVVRADVASGVAGSDSGTEAWFFMAPTDRFMGDLSAAYNGRLSFTLTHAETPANAQEVKAPDVVLEAACGHSLMLYDFAGQGGVLSVMLNEDAGWIDSRTKRPPSVMDFLGVLAHLAAVKIRGGYYTGAESTRLSAVSITSGKAWHPCCTIDGTVDICQQAPSSYYNPPNLQFYCEGHMYRPVRVTRVLPRFSRRTGGATITVIGENFGLAGSDPIVRINGRACQRTYFPPSVVRNDYNSLESSLTANTYTLMGTGDTLVEPSNAAGNALVNAYNSATDSMKQRYPEHCWNGMQDDGTSRGYNYGTAIAPKYIDQGEVGIDTGGPCFPLHCSSCPVPTRLSGAFPYPKTGTTSEAAYGNLGSGTYVAPHSGTSTVLAGDTSLVLADDASTLDGYYNGMIIHLVDPVANTGEYRVITAYDGATKTAYLPIAATAGATTYTISIIDQPTTGTVAAFTVASVTMEATMFPAIAHYYTGLILTITGGVGAGQSREIIGYSAAGVLTTASAWATDPDTSSTYSIGPRSYITGTALAGATGPPDTIDLAVGSAAIDGYYTGMVITITGGPGAGQVRTIIDYTAANLRATVARAAPAPLGSAWTTPPGAPGATSTYVITAPSVHGRCSASNQIQGFSSGDCKGRALTAAGKTAACSFKFPYLKYPSLCPEDAEYTTTLKEMSTQDTFGPIKAALLRKMFKADGIYAATDGDKQVEAVARITHPNPSKADTSSATATFVATTGIGSGGTTTSLVLASDASTQDGYYVGMIIHLVAANEYRVITAYDGATRTAYWPIAATIPTTYSISVIDQPTTGTAAAGAATTLTMQAAPAHATFSEYYTGLILTITGGTGVGQSREIIGYDGAGVLTVASAWTTTPDTTSTYKIGQRPFITGTVAAATANTVDLAADSAAVAEYYTGMVITITGGVGAGQVRTITGYSAARQATVASWTTTPDTTSTYSIGAKSAVRLPTKLQTIEIDDAVALCGITVEGEIGDGTPNAAVTVNTDFFASAVDGATITASGPIDGTGYFAKGVWTSSVAVSERDTNFGTGYVLIGAEIIEIKAVAGSDLTIKARGAFGTPISNHAVGAAIHAVSVCRGAVLSISPSNGQKDAVTSYPEGVLGPYTGQNQAGDPGGNTLIKLAATSSTVTDFYVNLKITITKADTVAGPTAGQTRTITAYNAGTKIATVDSAWAITAFGGTTAGDGEYVIATTYSGVTAVTATSATTITLAVGSSTKDDFYKGKTITVGGDATTARTITGYVGSTRIATVDSPFAALPLITGNSITLGAYVISDLYTGLLVTGGAATAVLAVGSSVEDSFYNGMKIKITGGPGVGEERLIVGYVGATRTITLATAFSTTTTAASTYSISAVSGDTFTTVSAFNAVCSGYNQEYGRGGTRRCTLKISTSAAAAYHEEIVNRLNVGDVVRRVPAGRAIATSTLAPSGVALSVNSVAALFGKTDLFFPADLRYVSCGSDGSLEVTAATLATNQLVIATGTSDNVMSGSTLTCVPGSIVTVKPTPAVQGPDSYAGPTGDEYSTTFDAASVFDSPESDLAEFATWRYIQMGGEIMRITALQERTADVPNFVLTRAAYGLERITVARGQLGTTVDAHPRGSKITLLPRMAEVTAAMTATSSKVFLPTGKDIIANNLAVISQVAAGTEALSVNPAATLQTGLADGRGGSTVASYIKIDDEIMKVVGVTTTVTTNGNEASLTVLRAQAGTLATPHSAGAILHVMGCMDGDETGSNCGGSCKPCSAPAKEGPTQQERLVCITPEGDSGPGPSGQGAGDLPVTVEAAPGPKDSPFGVRLNSQQNGLVDASTKSVSCISEQNRGFMYGAHDFVWGVHIKSKNALEKVTITDMAVDRNTGDTYVVGTMEGQIYIQGKHIHMSSNFGGELSVTPSQTWVEGIVANGDASATQFLDTSTNFFASEYLTDLEGKTIEIRYRAGAPGAAYSDSPRYAGCRSTVTGFPTAATPSATIGFTSPMTNANGAACAVFSAATSDLAFRVYSGTASFVAKFSKDGRPVWLNKLDMAREGHQVEVTSVTVDPTTGSYYIAGHYSDGYKGFVDAVNPVMRHYDIDSTTRVAGATATSIAFDDADVYGQTKQGTSNWNTAGVAVALQEGFLLKYSAAGQWIATEAIKGGAYTAQLQVSNLKVHAYHAATSSTLNTQFPSDEPAPTVKTSTSLVNVEYDFGMALAASKGGGTELRSSIQLALHAAKYFPPDGQAVSTATGGAVTTELMDDWYNGLQISITCGQGMGQTRTIQDYDAGTQTAYVQPHWDLAPDTTSCYTITGKPSSHISGKHLASGGVYVTGNLWGRVSLTAFATSTSVPDNGAVGSAKNEYVCFGQMPDSYRDTGSSAGIPVCAQFTAQNEEANFLAQYDKDLRVYWARFIYDAQAVAVDQISSGLITAVTVVDDLVYIAGTFGKAQWNPPADASNPPADVVSMRLQNCSFDSAPVVEGPPANSQPTVVTLKKLCRVQDMALTGIGAFPVQTENNLIGGGAAAVSQSAFAQSAGDGYGFRNTLASEYVAIPYVQKASSATNNNMYVAAYDGSGMLVWFHHTAPAEATTAPTPAAEAYSITPNAITALKPAIGNKPLTGHWKAVSDSLTLEGRKQPGDATGAKDISSERRDSAVVRGGYVYVAGTIKTTTANDYADFGITKYPLECSRDKSVGQKHSDASILDRMQDTPCAGLLQSLGANEDVFLVQYAAKGVPRHDTTYATYGIGTQPEVQYIRRTGMAGADEAATSIAVHDLTGATFVVGTYKATTTGKYQGSDIGELTYLATTGNDGGYTATASRPDTIISNSGDDHFGLSAANRVNSVGCPMQRFAPESENAEKLGLTGLPDCTLYSHAASQTTTTGFVVKFNDNGDETLRGNKNRKNIPSITGRISASGACTGGICSSSITPCAGGTAETTIHEYTNPSSCSTYPGGCSCLLMDSTTFSKTNAGAPQSSSGTGLANTWNGMKVRITKGKAAGYEGVISAYLANGATDYVYYTVPALPEVPDQTSEFQLFASMEPQPKIHLSDCSATLDVGCNAYGVEWAKTVGLPIGQSLTTMSAYGGPTNILKHDSTSWKQVGAAGAAAADGKTDTITLNILDGQKLATADTSFFDDYIVEFATQTAPPFTAIQTGNVVGPYTQAANGDGEVGGTLGVVCRSAVPAGQVTSAVGTATYESRCPLGSSVFYRLVYKKTSAAGTSFPSSTGSRQESAPVSVRIIDSNVYIGGKFQGFDQFPFGIEGVDETIGYKSVSRDTWESYLVKLED